MKTLFIAQRIREYRYAHRLTQEEFASRIGVSAQAVSKWERATCYPDITLLPQLAAVMQCSVEDFFPAIVPESTKQ